MRSPIALQSLAITEYSSAPDVIPPKAIAFGGAAAFERG